MQKVLRRMLVVLAGLAGMIPAGAGATTITYTLPGSPICLSANAPAACNAGGASVTVTAYSFSFDFPGVPGADEIITAATLTLNVWDDFGPADGSEKIDLALDVDDILVNGDVQNDIVISLADLDALSDNLLVTLGAHTGDFFFGGASLTLTVEDRPTDPGQDEIPGPAAASVPLPTSLALLGLGLAALAVRRRA